MNRYQKKLFIRDLCRAIEADAIKAIPHMPDAWDGHELRAYLAGKFDQSMLTVGRSGPYGRPYAKRTREYRNTLLTVPGL